MIAEIEPQTFVSVVRPLLESNNVHGLVETLHSRWNCSQISNLVAHADRDTRKVALLCLAMVGDKKCIPIIEAQLSDADSTVNDMAEHALWSIWFRSGSSQANAELCKGARELSFRHVDEAIEHFNRTIAHDKDFAEAYNQRAIARYMVEEFEASIADCRKAVRLMPCHFGAWAGMGHCFLNLGQLEQALRAYDRAIAINPHLHGLQQTMAEIRQRLQAGS